MRDTHFLTKALEYRSGQGQGQGHLRDTHFLTKALEYRSGQGQGHLRDTHFLTKALEYRSGQGQGHSSTGQGRGRQGGSMVNKSSIFD